MSASLPIHGGVLAQYLTVDDPAAGEFAWFWLPVIEDMQRSRELASDSPTPSETKSLQRLNIAPTKGPSPSPAAPPPTATKVASLFVLGDALFSLDLATFRERRVVWLLDSAASVERLTDSHIAQLGCIYSPLLPSEWPRPAEYPVSLFAAALAKTRFVPIPPKRGKSGGFRAHGETEAPTFHVQFVAITEPIPLIVWTGIFRSDSPSAADLAALAAAMLALDAPAGWWLLPPPFDQLPAERVRWFALHGGVSIPCPTIRAGAAEALRRERSPRLHSRPPAPQVPATSTLIAHTDDFPGYGPAPYFVLSRRQIGASLALAFAIPPAQADDPFWRADPWAPAIAPIRAAFLGEPALRSPNPSGVPSPSSEPKTATSNFADSDLKHTPGMAAGAFVRSEIWRDPLAAVVFRSLLDAQTPQAKDAFLGGVLSQLPLSELYDRRSERVQRIATFGLRLLGPIDERRNDTTTEVLRLVMLALTRDGEVFDQCYRRGLPSFGLRFALAGLSLSWFAQLEWSPPPLSDDTASAQPVPPELSLAAALACASRGNWSDTVRCINLVHRVDPELFLRPPTSGRWNKFLFWGLLGRSFNSATTTAQALAWAQETDITFEDQEFLCRRDYPVVPVGFAPLPEFPMPWTQ